MSSRTLATQRVPVLILVVAAHVAALFALIALNRVTLFRKGLDEPSVLVWLPQPQEPPKREPTASPAPSPPVQQSGSPPMNAAPVPDVQLPDTAIAPETLAPDWVGAAHDAAESAIAKADTTQRQAAKFAAPHSDIFVMREQKSQFQWNPENKRRFEPIAGGVALHLNDNCAVAVVLLFPFFGCSLDKIPSRGDLFEHMKDAPESGAWKDH